MDVGSANVERRTHPAAFGPLTICLLIDYARYNCLQFVTNQRMFLLYHRGAFWRLLAALQIQLNRSPSSTPARQRFRLPGFFVFTPPYHVAI